MKILSLRLKNLNSLKGEWKIDFTAEPFASNGLFAITGATGAGRLTTRRKISARSCGLPTVSERLQLPITTEVTPCRTDSANPGAISTSTS